MNPVAQQLKIFDPVILEHAELVAESPKKAFWNIRLEQQGGTFTVIKESGTKNVVRDKRKWPHGSYEKAKKDYDRRLKAKLNPDRKSPRKYRRK